MSVSNNHLAGATPVPLLPKAQALLGTPPQTPALNEQTIPSVFTALQSAVAGGLPPLKPKALKPTRLQPAPSPTPPVPSPSPATSSSPYSHLSGGSSGSASPLLGKGAPRPQTSSPLAPDAGLRFLSWKEQSHTPPPIRANQKDRKSKPVGKLQALQHPAAANPAAAASAANTAAAAGRGKLGALTPLYYQHSSSGAGGAIPTSPFPTNIGMYNFSAASPALKSQLAQQQSNVYGAASGMPVSYGSHAQYNLLAEQYAREWQMHQVRAAAAYNAVYSQAYAHHLAQQQIAANTAAVTQPSAGSAAAVVQHQASAADDAATLETPEETQIRKAQAGLPEQSPEELRRVRQIQREVLQMFKEASATISRAASDIWDVRVYDEFKNDNIPEQDLENLAACFRNANPSDEHYPKLIEIIHHTLAQTKVKHPHARLGIEIKGNQILIVVRG